MNADIGKTLKNIRKMRGFSMNYVSDILKKEYNIELSPKTLYGYENGVSQPNADTFVCICRIYEIDTFNIFLND